MFFLGEGFEPVWVCWIFRLVLFSLQLFCWFFVVLMNSIGHNRLFAPWAGKVWAISWVLASIGNLAQMSKLTWARYSTYIQTTFPQLTFPLLQLATDGLLHLWRNGAHMNRQHRSDTVGCLEVMSCIQQQRPGPSVEMSCDQWICLAFPWSGWNSFRHATFLHAEWHGDMVTCSFLEQGENPDSSKRPPTFVSVSAASSEDLIQIWLPTRPWSRPCNACPGWRFQNCLIFALGEMEKIQFDQRRVEIWNHQLVVKLLFMAGLLLIQLSMLFLQ